MLIHTFFFLIGLLIVAATFVSAVSMFVLPRAAPNQIVRLVFGLMRRVFEIPIHKAKAYHEKDRIMAYYAPMSLMLLVPTWYALVITGYVLMFWSAGVDDWSRALRLSGSSILTLGFESDPSVLIDLLIFSEALIGLTLVALLIAYLPSMYSAFSKREALVNLLEVRAGNPPSVKEMLSRYHRIHGLDRLTDIWRSWETWFVELEESHTTLPPLVFFRSPHPDHSWITSAGAVLDSAAFTLSTVDIPQTAEAALCIRSGYIALRSISDAFNIPYSKTPHFPEDPISVTRAEYDQLCADLMLEGIPLKPDRDQAWIRFAGWRVNYDKVLLVLGALTMAPSAPWSGDRAPKLDLPPLWIMHKK